MVDIHNKRHCLLAFALSGYLVCGQSAVASQKEYLEAIEADVEEFSTGTFELSKESTWVGSGVENSATAKKSDSEKLESFSAFLENASPGSFIFFKKLTPELKRKVVDEYLEIGDLERTKKSILQYATSQRRR